VDRIAAYWKDALMDDGEPGYCACCREFHLLRRAEIPELAQPVDVCQYCDALGPATLAWRIAGLNEGGSFGYEDAPPTVAPPRRTIGQRARIAWLRLQRRI
jgi:hypothetical protein